eukprot:6819146-Prymnesium_polylepis.1
MRRPAGGPSGHDSECAHKKSGNRQPSELWRPLEVAQGVQRGRAANGACCGAAVRVRCARARLHAQVADAAAGEVELDEG